MKNIALDQIHSDNFAKARIAPAFFDTSEGRHILLTEAAFTSLAQKPAGQQVIRDGLTYRVLTDAEYSELLDDAQDTREIPPGIETIKAFDI